MQTDEARHREDMERFARKRQQAKQLPACIRCGSDDLMDHESGDLLCLDCETRHYFDGEQWRGFDSEVGRVDTKPTNAFDRW